MEQCGEGTINSTRGIEPEIRSQPGSGQPKPETLPLQEMRMILISEGHEGRILTSKDTLTPKEGTNPAPFDHPENTSNGRLTTVPAADARRPSFTNEEIRTSPKESGGNILLILGGENSEC